MDEVERGEGAEEARLQEQHQCEVERDAVFDLPRGGHANGDDNGREQKHQEAEAVDAYVVLDVERGDPGETLLELHRAERRIEAVPEDKDEQQRGEGEGQRYRSGEGLAAIAEG